MSSMNDLMTMSQNFHRLTAWLVALATLAGAAYIWALPDGQAWWQANRPDLFNQRHATPGCIARQVGMAVKTATGPWQASLVCQSPDRTLADTEAAPFIVRVKNTGKATWKRGGGCV